MIIIYGTLTNIGHLYRIVHLLRLDEGVVHHFHLWFE